MKKAVTALMVSGMLSIQALTTSAEPPKVAQAPSGQMPAVGDAQVVKVRGTIAAIDKQKRTVTLEGPQGRTLILDVQDPLKFDLIKVGDPVVATYVQEVAIQVKLAGTVMPGITEHERRISSTPDETPAGVASRQIIMTGTVTAIDPKMRTLTIKGALGREDTLKVKEPKYLEGVKSGDTVEITYTQALAVSLDKAGN